MAEFFFFASALAGAGISGWSASVAQSKIKSSVCEIAKQMGQYKDYMASEANLLSIEAAQVQNQLDELSLSIINLKDEARIQYAAYKKTYNTMTVLGYIFLVLLIFIFAAKKIILRATTSPV